MYCALLFVSLSVTRYDACLSLSRDRTYQESPELMQMLPGLTNATEVSR